MRTTSEWMRQRPSSRVGKNSGNVQKSVLPLTATGTPTYSLVLKDGDGKKKALLKGISRNRLLAMALLVCVILTAVLLFGLGFDAKEFFKEIVDGVFEKAEVWGLAKKAAPFETDYLDDYPDLKILEDNWMVMRDEVENILNTRKHQVTDVQNLKSIYNSKVKWKTLWLKLFTDIEENTHLAPKTVELLSQVPNVYTVFLSIMDPHQKLIPHWGYYKGYLRYQLALIIPKNNADHNCFLRINQNFPQTPENWELIYHHKKGADTEQYIDKGKRYYWEEGKGVMFDDTYLHDATNGGDTERVVLFVDIARNLPWYLNIYNKICLFIARFDSSVKDLRNNAIVAL